MKPSKNDFIVRQKKDGRTVSNFEIIEEVLKNTILNYSDLKNTLLEKINLLNECKSLMGIFGSGLTNMIFLNKDSNVIEIRASEDRHNNAFFHSLHL